MRCWVSFCNNSTENVSQSDGVSFHNFPGEGSVALRALWLRALGKRGAVPACAAVCSRHFLCEDMCEAGGERLLRAGAVPAAVQVCMICLDTDGKMFSMSKYNLEEAYEHLTGYSVCDEGKLKHVLCVECAQILSNFNKFRDKSLRARALLMDLVKKHKVIMMRHIVQLNRARIPLKSSLSRRTLGADPCDLHVLEESVAKQYAQAAGKTECEDPELDLGADAQAEVKSEAEGSADENGAVELASASEVWVKSEAEGSADEHGAVEFGDDNVLRNLAECRVLLTRMPRAEELALASLLQKCENVKLQCAECYEQFPQEEEYGEHACSRPRMTRAPRGSRCLSGLYAGRLSVNDQKRKHPDMTDQALKTEKCHPVFDINNYEEVNNKIPSQNDNKDAQCTNTPSIGLQRNWDGYIKTEKVVPNQENSQTDSHIQIPTLNIHCRMGDLNPTENILRTHSDDSGIKRFICDVCQNVFERKNILVSHMRNHTDLQSKVRLESDLSAEQANREQGRFADLSVGTILQDAEYLGKDETLTASPMDICFSEPNAQNNDTGSKILNYKTTSQHKLPTSRTIVPVYAEKTTSNVDTTMGGFKTQNNIEAKDRFICDICENAFKSKRNLVSHIKIRHCDKKNYSCLVCQRKFIYNSSLVTHLMTHTGEKPYACELCAYRGTKSSSLVTHMRTHTGEKPFACKLCQHACNDKSALLAHMETHTGVKPLACKLCQYKCTQNSSLVKHMLIHTGEKPFACNLCQYKSITNKCLVRHMRTHTGEKPYACNLCEYKCANTASLRWHKNCHHGGKSYACNLCQRKCADKSSLRRHKNIHGEKPSNACNNLSYACNVCPYKSSLKYSLVAHKRIHTGEKPYACKICQRKFRVSSDLVLHMRSHTGEKPYTCKLCPYKSACRNYLVVHMRSHTGERPFVCDVCLKQFTTKSNLNYHKRIHTRDDDK